MEGPFAANEKKELTLDGVGEAAALVVGDRENGSVAEKGEGTPGVASEDPDLASSEHQGTCYMSPSPEGTLLNQLQDLMNKNMATMNKIIKLNTAETSLAIAKSENNLVKKHGQK